MSLDKIPRMTVKFEGRVQSSAFRPKAATIYSIPISPWFPNEKAAQEPPGPGWELCKNLTVVDGIKQ